VIGQKGRLTVDFWQERSVLSIESIREMAKTTVRPIKSTILRTIKSWINELSLRLWVARLCRRLWCTIRMRANEGVCSIEIDRKGPVGFFAQMNWCLYMFQYCERCGLIPDIHLTDKIYLDRKRGPNWLGYYFDPSKPMSSQEITRRVRYTKKISDFRQIGLPATPNISVDEGARLLRKYLLPKPHIIKIVDDFWRALNVDGPVLGVHFRGTDKSSEAPRVSWDYCLTVIEKYLHENNSLAAVFVSSDEQKFIDFIKISVTDVPVHSRDDHYRSVDDRPVHIALEGGGYEKGEDALVNALVLAKCAILIRTTSFLSAWASIFNPNIKVVLLNKPYDNHLWYPEREILRRHDTEYLPELWTGRESSGKLG
jgi:hypothetical protein